MKIALSNSMRNRVSLVAVIALFLSLSNSSFAQNTIVEKHGQLKVQGNRIVDKNGTAVQLRGMSLYWSQWIGKFYNRDAVQWLRDDWRCTVVRAAMAVDNDGYAKNPVAEQAKVVAVVDAAIELGIYVIIDFHAHEAQNYKPEAFKFFAAMAKKYANVPNVMYEPWNEPYQEPLWATVIKPYHEEVIDTIRKYDPDNIIICGTRSWSQQVEEAANNPINKPNIAYTLHFYAGSHGQWLRDAAKRSLDKGVALFVTEYGTVDASGNGAIAETETKAWWAFLDANKIGHANWSVADIGESSAILYPGASATGGWTTAQIKPSGILVRNELRAKYVSPSAVTTGLEEDALNKSEVIYPNPSAGAFQVKTDEAFTYVVYDKFGRVAEVGKGQPNTSIGANLTSGLYFIKIKSRTSELVKKIVKQ